MAEHLPGDRGPSHLNFDGGPGCFRNGNASVEITAFSDSSDIFFKDSVAQAPTNWAFVGAWDFFFFW